MKKKIVALLLVLVLAVAIMVPVFAASVEPRACSHTWMNVGANYEVIRDYDDWTHSITTYIHQTCNKFCGASRELEVGTTYQSHVYGTGIYCVHCNHRKTS